VSVLVSAPWFRVGGTLVVTLAMNPPAVAQEGLVADRYVEIVLRAHPSAAQSTGLELAAAAERKAARLIPDPVFEYSRDRGTPTGAPGSRATEAAYSVSQTIPWPGRFSAGIRAGDRAADTLRAGAEGLRWELAALARQAFARLTAARALRDVARGAEADARSLRDLVSRRAELGESREADRIKATVEWLRQQRNLAAAEREAEASEAIVRALAVQPLPAPLSIRPVVHEALPQLDREALAAQIVERSPRLRAARAEAERQQALLSATQRARIPDLDVTVFKDRELDKEATGFAIGVKVPLWNGNRGEIARAQAASRVSSAEAARVRIELVTELQGRLKELQIAGDQASLLDREILPAAHQSVGLVRLSFEEGETSLLDLLDAQRTFRDTQREAAEAHLALSLALGEVQKLAGPDFNPWR
jgi:cobalt-zinc-cadmium efflux system outer membrane protein